MRVQPFAYVKTLGAVTPTGPTLFPQWEQTWDATLSEQYLDALVDLSGSTAQQMNDMGWSISASLVFTDTNDYETAVIKDKWIVAASFTTNTLLKIDTTANSASLFTISAGDTPTYRMRGGFAPSGSDSIVFRNNNGEFLRFNPETNETQLYTTSSNISGGPSGGTPDWNWEYFGTLNATSTGDQNYSIKMDSLGTASFDYYIYTGSANTAASYLNPSNGKPTFISYNDVIPNAEFDSTTREFISTGSTLSSTEEFETCEMMPYITAGVRDGYQIILTDVKSTSSNSIWRYRNGDVEAILSSGPVNNPKARQATLGPDGNMYSFNAGTSFIRQYNPHTDFVNNIPVSGSALSEADFNYRLYMAANGAMYAIPFVNGTNVYRLSLPLTGSDADNIYNLVHSPYYNKGK